MWITNPTDAALGGGTYYTWLDAITACEGLTYAGFTDWRLPNVRELMSIVDYGAAVEPRINTTAFPATDLGAHWTSTTYVPSTSYAWIVEFSLGTANASNKINGFYLQLCVRGGP